MEKGVGGGTGVRKITPMFLLPEPQVGGLPPPHKSLTK